jgi:ABC-type polysaccharide/polyol phosphate export permease
MLKKVLKEASEIVRFHELLRNLVVRDIKVRYRRSVLGFVWVMLNPLLMMLVLSAVFSEVFRITTKNYTVYLLSGIVLWNFFSQSTAITVQAFLGNSNLIKKIYVPKSIFPLSTIISALVNFLFSLVPLILIVLFTGTPLSSRPHLLLIALALLFLFSLGIALLLSTITVFFHDVVYIYDVVLLAWMYATPVFYPEEIIPERFSVILHLNPMYYFMSLFRGGLYMDLPDVMSKISWGCMYASVSLIVGFIVYIAYKDKVIYYL